MLPPKDHPSRQWSAWIVAVMAASAVMNNTPVVVADESSGRVQP